MSTLATALATLTLLAAAPEPAAAPAPTEPTAMAEGAAPTELAAPVNGEPTEAEIAQMLDAFDASLTYQRGEITLPNGKAVLTVPEGFRFLATDDARRVLEQLWSNPPNPTVLGMLCPADVSPADPNGWAVVIQYTEDGHIDDADAASIDYDELLETMQAGLVEENKQRREQGFSEVHLGGWAEPPHYDATTRKLYWAKQLRFGDDPAQTLNYAIRVLGREGVLELNAVAPLERLPVVKPAMEQVLGFVEFTANNRYSDFDPDSDKTAAYGIGGLIAGAVVASKTGLLKGLWIALLAGKKFIVLGVVAIGAFFARKFGNNNNNNNKDS